jgi:hypothetical protein
MGKVDSKKPIEQIIAWTSMSFERVEIKQRVQFSETVISSGANWW